MPINKGMGIAVASLFFALPAMADINAVLQSQDEDIIEQACEYGAESNAKGSEAIIATVKHKPFMLRPVMECIYWDVDPEDFRVMVDNAVDELNKD